MTEEWAFSDKLMKVISRGDRNQEPTCNGGVWGTRDYTIRGDGEPALTKRMRLNGYG